MFAESTGTIVSVPSSSCPGDPAGDFVEHWPPPALVFQQYVLVLLQQWLWLQSPPTVEHWPYGFLTFIVAGAAASSTASSKLVAALDDTRLRPTKARAKSAVPTREAAASPV